MNETHPGQGPSGDPERDAGVYWSLSRQNQQVREQSHWRGVGRWETESWEEIGNFHLRLLEGYLERFADPAARGTLRAALEWGPGGGSNMQALCIRFEQVCGVDISPENLDECKRQLDAYGFDNFSGFLIPSSKPETILQVLERGSFDLCLSTAVFQHFPSKDYAQRVLDLLAQLLRPGAFGLIQVRYDDGTPCFQSKTGDYFKNAITMTSFGQDEFRAQLERSGFESLSVERDLNRKPTNYEYHFFRRSGG